MMYLDLWFMVLGVTLLLGVWRAYAWLRSGIVHAEDPEPRHDYPSISVIRPIKGLDAGAAENIRAALEHGYPGDVETFFVFDDDSEPAVPLVKGALAERKAAGRSDQARILFAGQPPASQTGKLNAMIAGLRVANNELIAFIDSDVRQDSKALTAVVDTLLDSPDAGSAFAPVVATEPAATVGDAGYLMLINGLYGPAAASTVKELGGEMPFIMGQFMVLRREAMAAIGGLESADGQLVDDMFLGMRLKEFGYRNVVSSHRVSIVQRGMSVGDFVGTFVRWIAFSRSGLPALSFKLNLWLMGVAYWLGLVAAGVALAKGFGLVASLNLLAPVFVSLVISDLHTRLGGAPLRLRHWWVAFAIFLSAPVIYGSVFLRHEVNWRGRRYQLNTNSRLG